ncbi:MAG: hypothetical protein HKL85_10805 [Acidimicrobiaceae bacterium]|nr:hypothetical protein [Acidimicrobiaceae bacterium]
MAATVATPTPAQATTSHAYEPMPNFVGMGRTSVYAEMFSAQLYFKTTGVGANTSQWVRVVSEIPAAGTMIHPLSTVILQVSSTPAPIAVTVAAARHAAAPVRPVTSTKPVTKHVISSKPVTKKHVTAKGPVTKKHVISTKPVVKRKGTVTVLAVTRKNVAKPTSTKKKITHPQVVDFRVGVATWYSYFPGQCASWYLPQGTRINVESLITHRVVSCVVTDRQAAKGNRVVDLSEAQFAELAPLGVGVVPVRVTW